MESDLPPERREHSEPGLQEEEASPGPEAMMGGHGEKNLPDKLPTIASAIEEAEKDLAEERAKELRSAGSKFEFGVPHPASRYTKDWK